MENALDFVLSLPKKILVAIKREPKNTLAALILLAVAIFSNGYLDNLGENLVPKLQESSSITIGATDYAPQNMINSPGGLQVQADNVKIEKNNLPKPTLEYNTLSAPEKKGDGLYHATYNVYFYDPLGTGPKNFKLSAGIDCEQPENGTPYFNNGRVGIIFQMNCWMQEIPLDDVKLFFLG